MRNAFAQEIKDQAGVNDKIVLLSADIGNRLFDPYKELFPDRFFNCGVAEANMTSMAAGMAMNCMQPVTYTIASFNTSRCYEQIKIDICYHDLPVIVVGVGAGLSYAGLGATHHSFEDISIIRTLPNMHVMCPCDSVEVKLCLQEALNLKKPVYIRLCKKNEPIIHKSKPKFRLGKGIVVKQGKDVCLLGCGNILPVVMDAAEKLDQNHISAMVVSMHTVKPLDADLLNSVFSNFNMVCTIEEHSAIGGFGSAVAEWVVDNGISVKNMIRFAIPDDFLHRSGNQNNARKMAGLTCDNIFAAVLKNYH